MVPSLLFPLDQIELNQLRWGRDEIERINPHRGAMRMLDGIIWANEEMSQAVAFKDIENDAFWVPGHIPGRPLFPGVLMIEAGAQLASYLTKCRVPALEFMGFVGVDDVKFRGQVVPGDRLIILGKEVSFRRRRSVCDVQGVVKGTLVFEGRITGMPI